MKYISAVTGSILALIVFTVAVIFIQGQGESRAAEIILTISTFLFAILAGFYISRANARYDRLRDLVSREDALFLSLYQTAAVYGTDFQKRIGDVMDKYYIACYDQAGLGYYKMTIPSFMALYEEVVRLNRYRAESAFQQLLTILSGIEESRNQTSVLHEEKISLGQWLVMISLSGIIVFSIFYLTTPVFYSQLITVLLSTILVMILLILRDLLNLRFVANQLSVEESGQENLEIMGKLRYYNQALLSDGLVNIPSDVKRYRLGEHRPGEAWRIRIVDVTKPNNKT